LNLILQRPKEEDREGFGQGKNSRSASHLVLYLGKGIQILIRLLGSVADVKVACKYPFSLPLASGVHIPHKGHPYLQRLQLAWNLHPQKGGLRSALCS